MKYVFAAAFVAVTLVQSAVAAPEWIKVTSDNFELYTSASEREARETLVFFEQVRDFFMRVKSQTVTTRLPVTIVGFRNPKEYKPYSPNEAAAAYYQGDEQRDYIVMGSLDSEKMPVAIHEYMHLLIRHSGLKVPIWFNEGFAEVYSTLKPMGGNVVLGNVPQGRGMVLAQHKWLPLAKLLSITHESAEYNEKDRAGVFYAQSWLLMHMLMLGDDYRAGFNKFVAAINGNPDAEKAFETAYHKKLWEIELDMNSYFHANKLNGIGFKTRFEKIQIGPGKPAGDLELGITLANLKMLLGKYDEATERFGELAKAHPQNAEVEEALAYLAWRQNRREEALKHFSRAVAIGGVGWKTYWDYARLMGPQDADAYVDALRKTLQLKPDVVEARLALGSELVRRRSWAQGLTTLRVVTNIDGERAPDLFLMMAFCAMNLDLKDEARKYADNAKKYAKDSKHQQQVDQLITYMDRRDGTSPAAPRAVSAPSEAPPTKTAASQPTRLNVKGNFKRLDCLGDVARVHVMDGRDTLVLLMRQPLSGGLAFKCGPQNSAVSVDYVPGKDDKYGTVGEVRQIQVIE